MGIKYRTDADLEFLQYCTEEDIKQLAHYLIFDKDGERRIASEIPDTKDFKALESMPDKWRKCWQLVAGELQHYGGDSFVNLFRGGGVLYREICTDVCDKFKINYPKSSSTYDIEEMLIEELIKKSLDKMSRHEKLNAMLFMNVPSRFIDDTPSQIIEILKQNEIDSFKCSSWLAQSAVTTFSPYTLSGVGLGATAAFIGSRGATAIAGPLAAVILTVPLLSGTAYRITVPAVIQISYMRRKYEQKERF